MSARWTAIGAIVGAVVAAVVLSTPGAAQVEGGGEKGLFSTLRVGQMVEVRQDRQVGIVITTYEDPAFHAAMNLKIVEIGHDYIAVESAVLDTGIQTEMRYPVTSIAAVAHARKKGDAKSAPKRKP
jgi:hypothetical protein